MESQRLCNYLWSRFAAVFEIIQRYFPSNHGHQIVREGLTTAEPPALDYISPLPNLQDRALTINQGTLASLVHGSALNVQVKTSLQPQSRLLSLPGELRVMIWRHRMNLGRVHIVRITDENGKYHRIRFCHVICMGDSDPSYLGAHWMKAQCWSGICADIIPLLQSCRRV